MSRTDPALVVRLPADLKERLRSKAEADRRTLTGQVIHLLEQALPQSEKAEVVGATSAE